MNRNFIRRILVLIVLLQTGLAAYGQGQKVKVVPIFTADSLKSGNYKDVLTSFFQLASDNLSGPNKEFRFTSNPFAVMLRSNPVLAVDTNWVQYRHLRDLNFNVALKTDSDFKFRGFKVGVKYAIINKRDVTVSKAFIWQVLNDKEGREWDSISVFIGKIQSTIKNDPELRKKFREEMNKLTGSDTSFTYRDLSKEVREYISTAARDLHLTRFDEILKEYPEVSLREAFSTDYNKIREAFMSKPLWTIALDGTSYNDQVLFSNVQASSQFLVGITCNRKHTRTLELDLRAQYNLDDDSIMRDRDLQRQTLSFQPRVNLSFRTKKENKSFFEFKLGGNYTHVFSAQYPGEKNDKLFLDTEMRIRVYDDIWIPLSLQYAPDNGKFFGFLNISANFTGM